MTFKRNQKDFYILVEEAWSLGVTLRPQVRRDVVQEGAFCEGTEPTARSGRTWEGARAWKLEAKREQCTVCP